MDVPAIRYASNGDVSIAYSTSGDGPRDLVILPFMSNVAYQREHPRIADMLDRVATIARVILVDRRGTGLSDRPEAAADLESTIDDIVSVLDDAASPRPVLLGSMEGTHVAALFAGTHPARTEALILYNPTACYVRTPDYPLGLSAEEIDARVDAIRQGWGTEAFMDRMYETLVPSLAEDASFRHWFLTYFRLAASPAAAAAMYRTTMETDIRGALSAISAPTLVLYSPNHEPHALDVAERIPGAKAVELPLPDHWYAQADFVLGEIEEFLTGARAPTSNRVLATVLFTDIVRSTETANELGDRQWRDVLASHHALVRRELGRFRGHEVATAGDGFLATFDGPARAVRAATAVREAVRGIGLEVRAGVHTGEVEVVGDDVAGIAVHTGARVAAAAAPGEVLVSSTVKDLVAGSGLEFSERGEHELKGVPGTWRLYAVRDA